MQKLGENLKQDAALDVVLRIQRRIEKINVCITMKAASNAFCGFR